MRRILAALAALLWVAPASAESYSMIHAFPVPVNLSGIATTRSDSSNIRARFGAVDSYDAIRVVGHDDLYSYTGDGLQLPSEWTAPSPRAVAITTFSPFMSKHVFTAGSMMRNRIPIVVALNSTFATPDAKSWVPPCGLPRAIAAGHGSFYIFAGCGPVSAARYSHDAIFEPEPLTTYGSFTDPRYLAVAQTGHVWVTADGALWKFAADGSPLGSWSMPDAGPVAVDRLGNVFVIDGGTVRKFSPEGTQLAEWSSWATAGIAIGPYDDVYLLDAEGAVEKWRQDQSTPVTSASWGQVKARWR